MNISDYRYIIADSRSVFDPSATVFAAIRTEVGDGHRFIPALYDAGVRAFIVEEIPQGCPDAEFMKVDNVPAALADLARQRLDGIDSGIVVTGSHGKTTMKELLFTSLLSLGRKARRSPRSWNSSIGLPLAILDMTSGGADPDTCYITEAGIDGPGQAEGTVSVIGASHHTGIITAMDSEHDEAFASHEEKIREKVRLVSHCSTVFYADSDPALGRILREMLPDGAEAIEVTQGSHPTIFHAIAAEVLRHIGATDCPADIPDSIGLVNCRREITASMYGNTVIIDSFTPDLRSLREALDFMRRQTTAAQSSALVLGSMLYRRGISDAEKKSIVDEAFRLAADFGVESVQLADEIESRMSDYPQGKMFRDSRILLFGSREGALETVAREMEVAGHDTVLEVDLDAVIHNYNHYRSLVPAGTGIVAMVKASAYGLGSVEIGKTLQSHGAAYLAVAVIEEGIALREAGITTPVMVLNPVTNRYRALFDNNLEPAVFSEEELRRLIDEAEAYGVSAYPVHIKLDTGMHRVGFTAGQLECIYPLLRETSAVRVRSVFSHLATADCLDMDSYTQGQIDTFHSLAAEIETRLGHPFLRHILNTAGMMRFASAGGYEMARLGIGLYGISPFEGPEAAGLQPVATFRSRIISLKHWPEGTPIGYGCKGHTVGADSLIATVPVGYADGVNRRLSNGGTSFVVNGVECPTIGNICMDLCMIDVSAVPDVRIGDKVEIFGKAMPVETVAAKLGTIPYEILTSVAPRVRRTYIKR